MKNLFDKLKKLPPRVKIIIAAAAAVLIVIIAVIAAISDNSSKYIKNGSQDETKHQISIDQKKSKGTPSPTAKASQKPSAAPSKASKAPAKASSAPANIHAPSSNASSSQSNEEIIADISAENNNIHYKEETAVNENTGLEYKIPDIFTEDAQPALETQNYYAGDDLENSPVFISVSSVSADEWDEQVKVVDQYIEIAKNYGGSDDGGTITYSNGNMPSVLTYSIDDTVAQCEMNTRATEESILADYPNIESAPEGSRNFLMYYDNSGYMIKSIRDGDRVKIINVSYSASPCRTEDGLCDINTFNSYLNAAKDAFDNFK